jgi:hypothetical protein
MKVDQGMRFEGLVVRRLTFRRTDNQSRSLKSTNIMDIRARGLSKLPLSIYGNDFTFIVGGRRYGCPPIVADFLSPAVCRFRQTDTSINEYVLNIKDPSKAVTSTVRPSRFETKL